jgi:hypothetical protein
MKSTSLLLLLLALLPYPHALSLSTSEAQRGQTVVATISAPAGATVVLSVPPGVTSGPLTYLGGGTWRATLTIATDAPLNRTPGRVVLLVDGAQKDSAPIRIWTDAPRGFGVWLPIIRAGG